MNIDYNYEVKENGKSLYPSVSIGPISIEKAKHLLDWNPTSLHSILKESVGFYNTDMRLKFKQEFNEMLEDLPKEIQNHISKNS